MGELYASPPIIAYALAAISIIVIAYALIMPIFYVIRYTWIGIILSVVTSSILVAILFLLEAYLSRPESLSSLVVMALLTVYMLFPLYIVYCILMYVAVEVTKVIVEQIREKKGAVMVNSIKAVPDHDTRKTGGS